jgi:glycosyltransferase involved in cell wall biosynthesis
MTPSILFVHNHRTTFVEIDLNLLRELCPTEELFLRRTDLSPIEILRRVRRATLVFGWFASWHTLLPMLFARLLRKPSVLVVGGYDIARIPAIGYGHQRQGVRRIISQATMRSASVLMTNSFYSQREAERNAGVPASHIAVVYHGIPDPFGEIATEDRMPLVLTVGNVDMTNLRRKGLEPFVRSASLLRGLEFQVIGAWKDRAADRLRSLAGPNVALTGWLSREALVGRYRKASVYVQASQHEGFGMSVAEAMLGGCIPVVTRAGALPEVVGETGVYVRGEDVNDLADGVRRAASAGHDLRRACRERILTAFPLEKRRMGLRGVVSQAMDGTPSD